MAAQPLRRDKVTERTLAARGAKSGEVLPAVSQRIEGIPVAVEPDRRPVEVLAEAERSWLMSSADGHPSLTQPPAKFTTACATFGLPAAPGDGESAAARVPADGDARAIDEGLRQQHRRQRVEVAQRALRTGPRQRRLAAVALRTIGREAFVVEAFRATSPRRDGNMTAQPRAVNQLANALGS